MNFKLTLLTAALSVVCSSSMAEEAKPWEAGAIPPSTVEPAKANPAKTETPAAPAAPAATAAAPMRQSSGTGSSWGMPEAQSLPPSGVQYQYPQNPIIVIPSPSPSMQGTIQADQQQLMGMSPEEIRDFKKSYRGRLDAAVDRAPNLRTRTVTLDLSPGAGIPRIDLSPGQISSLNFIDIYGNPWPVAGANWGDTRAFGLSMPPRSDASAPQNVISVDSSVEVGNTTASILLTGLQTPIILGLTANRDVHDARVDLRINQTGPASQSMPSGRGLTTQAADATSVSILDGIPPKGAKKLDSSRNDLRAYQIGEKMYVRTWHDILSPPYSGVVNGAGGVRVYIFDQLVPVIVSSVQGSTQIVTLEGFIHE